MKEKLNFIATQYKNEEIIVRFFDKNNKEIPKEKVGYRKIKGQIVYYKK